MRLGRDYLLRELELLPLWKMRKFTPSSDMLASSCEENTETLKVAPAVPVESCSIAESSPVTEFDEHKASWLCYQMLVRKESIAFCRWTGNH